MTNGPWISRRQIAGLMAAAPLLHAGNAGAATRLSRPVGDFHTYAPRPPLGWNSWDSFGATINEAQSREIAGIMAKRLLPHGYDVFTVDIQWYEPGATGFEYRVGAPLEMDGHGRLLPAPNRFPSAAGGRGFRALADHVHGLGMWFGVHMMRGIPRQAVDKRLPVLGAEVTAADIADTTSVCRWNTDMYGVDMSKPGAQAYYDSIFRQFADWGIDFVKVDDMSRPYHQPEVEAVRTAIDRSGRAMVLSLSPGDTPLTAAPHVAAHANMWRISGDFWDKWSQLKNQFARLANWWDLPHTPGAWPDADMLPLGLINQGKRRSLFTPDEQRTVMTLWSIARSPLIMGGDLRSLDPLTFSLIANDEVLAVNQTGAEPRQVYARDGLVAWTSRAGGRTGGRYLALFNTQDGESGVPVPAPLAELGLVGGGRARDLWEGRDLGRVEAGWAPVVAPHAAKLYRLDMS